MEAYFEFKGHDSPDGFVIKIVEPEKIEHARKVLRGEEKVRVHVQGTIVQRKIPYNPRWNYYLKPESIRFFEMAIEVCDAAMGYVEENLNAVGGTFLPKSQWCPWASTLTREIPATELQKQMKAERRQYGL
jgi:hypothetical protein